ncbi:MAG: SGNH/GDSL hydrolase family protein [Allobaculum sp.]|nr:SGNH/GDSL hydrolase family protein [Allobaculum sp.]
MSTQKSDSKKRSKPIARRATLWILSCVGVLGIVGGITLTSILSNQSSLREGTNYLVNLDQTDIQALSTKLEVRNREEKRAKLNAALDDTINQETSIWPLFGNSIILGDSRPKGFSEFGFLPETIVWAQIGTSCLTIPDFTSRIQQALPEVIYISFGINDVLHGLGMQEENGYGSMMEEFIQELLAVSPNSKIVVNSIIPTATWLTNANPIWQNVPEYNRQLQEMCARNGWVYVNNDEICDNGNASVYEGDGIHFYSYFYELWAINMLRAQIEAL